MLPCLIFEQQSAIVPGRCITDNVVVAFEIIPHMRGVTRGQEGDVALKLDISKAYDKVDWNFLKQRMQALGICNKWISWIMRCVTIVSYDVCFNGMSIGPIIPKRGLRQGDSLSPYLFLFSVEGLSNLLDNAAEAGRIHRCRISPQAPKITHLFFKSKVEEATYIKRLLGQYAAKSDQAVNFMKSGVFNSSNVRRDKQEEISVILRVHNYISATNYLGLPSLLGGRKRGFLAF